MTDSPNPAASLLPICCQFDGRNMPLCAPIAEKAETPNMRPDQCLSLYLQAFRAGGADRIRTGEYRFCRPLTYGQYIKEYSIKLSCCQSVANNAYSFMCH